MSTWVNANVYFMRRAVCLVVHREEWLAYGTATGMPNLMEMTRQPDESTERALRDVIADLRPDLAGGTLWGMRYDMHYDRFEFRYAHPSLPRVVEGETLPFERLLPGPAFAGWAGEPPDSWGASPGEAGEGGPLT